MEKQYYECGTCGHFHRIGFLEDCRNDSERFTATELDEKHGEWPAHWDYVDLDEQREAE